MSVTPDLTPAPRVALHSAARGRRARSTALGVAAVFTASAAIAVVAAHLTAPGSASETTAPAPVFVPLRANVAEITAMPANESAFLAILRRPARASDTVHAILAGAGPFGANASLARTAAIATASLAPTRVSVVPANGGVCLRVLEAVVAQRTSSWHCTPTALAARGALIVTLLPAGAIPRTAGAQYVIGLVPDGVDRVTISTAAGTARAVGVRDNVYTTQLNGPRRVSFTVPGLGTISEPIRD